MYLNSIYFGSNAYGIESASNLYFDKSASELNINESAILAGIIKSPVYYSPINHPNRCFTRKNLVLKQMLDNGYIREEFSFLLGNSVDYEFRTTIVKELHTTEDIFNIAKWIKNAKRYFLQTYVDSGDTIKSGFSAYSAEEMLKLLENTRTLLPVTELRGV